MPVQDGVRLRLSLPEGAAAEPDADLPAIDVSNIAGAHVTLRRGYRAEDGTTLRALCAGAPSDRWAPGVEELILGRVNGVVHGSLGGEVEDFEATDIHAVGPRFEQGFEATVALPSGSRGAARGRHTLGFAGDARAAVLCSVVCIEPSVPGGRCAALIDAASLEGAFTEAPPPSLLIRAILLAAERPLATLGLAAAVVFALIALVLARRPKPRW